MNEFANIFDSTSAFLRAKGILPEVSSGKPASTKAVEQFHKQTGLKLPESFSAFFTDFANGYQFSWEESDEVWGMFAIPSLKDLATQQQRWKRNVHDFLNDPKSMDRCVRPPFRAQAFEIWRRMGLWIPFWDEGNGDTFCLDTSSGQILYDQHDWFDGFGSLANTNGIVAGANLADFVRQWSRFLFRRNNSHWWGEFSKFGAIKWEREYFDDGYCVDDS